MGVVSFPREQRSPIESPREISAVESLIAALVAAVGAAGGDVALGGHDFGAIPLSRRIRLLGEMYAAGRVAFAWRDRRDSRAVSATLERRVSSRTGASWRLELRLADDSAAAPVDVLLAPDVEALAARFQRALADGFARGRRAPGARVAPFAR